MFRNSAPRALGLVLAFSAPLVALQPGDSAPPISIEKWLLGEALTSVGQPSEHVTVIAFWATWSKPACDSLFELSEMQQQLSDKSVAIIAVCAEPTEKVQGFVQAHRAKLRHLRVGVDDDQKTTLAYMTAAGASALPHTFVVNKDGLLAWHGHPADLRVILDSVIAGTFDIPKPDSDTELADVEIDPQQQAAIAEAIEKGEWLRAVEGIDRVVQKHPGSRQAGQLLGTKFMILFERLGDFRAAEDCARQVLDQYAEHVDALNNIAWALLARGEFETLDHRLPELAHQTARKALEASERQNAAILDTYARSLYLLGYTDQALSYQRQAIDQFRAELREVRREGAGPEQLQQMQRVQRDMAGTLAYYEDISKLRQRFKPE